ncbi:MAG: DNA recombination protein RmuC [Betaproteobacteria bacterium]|nr:DNA recombination protein RmuC [Betaproteobacteria bacterium]
MTEPTLQWVALGALALVGAALRVFAIASWLRGRCAVSREDLDARQQELLGALRDGLAQSRQDLEDKHRAMLADLNEGLTKQRDRIGLLQLALAESLAGNRETLLARMGEQARAEQELLQTTLRTITQQLAERADAMTRTVDTRLEQISGKVNERLEEGFRKTNETFANVMARLATIDEAQKKIDGLTTNVVSLQELLGDKRSRGAFGEVQLEGLVRNLLPPDAYEFQAQLTPLLRVDCLLKLPAPTGNVPVDSKFPLENYQRLQDSALAPVERNAIQALFRADVRRHIDDIARKYIIPGKTADGAVMFLPAEAVFAEIHAYHPELVAFAQQRRVWIVSPTTLMAVLNTARAVLKDVETRKQVHVIQQELGRLAKDFGLFEERMGKLATHIRQAHEDVEQVHISSRKISTRFREIERVELPPEALDAGPEAGPPALP